LQAKSHDLGLQLPELSSCNEARLGSHAVLIPTSTVLAGSIFEVDEGKAKYAALQRGKRLPGAAVNGRARLRQSMSMVPHIPKTCKQSPGEYMIATFQKHYRDMELAKAGER
jgi:hypothetical protein